MGSIEKICYRAVEEDARLSLGSGGGQFVLLPAPMDHDWCFKEAGYEYFADSDDEWDRDFKGLIELVFNELGGNGEARLSEAFAEFYGKPCTVKEAFWIATLDDNFPPADVHFGEPALRRMVIGDGHEAIWVAFAEEAEEMFAKLLARVGERWPVEKIEINLDGLIPSHH